MTKSHSPLPTPHSLPKRVALVHNWLTVRGGSEKVLFALHDMYPDAPIYALVYRKEKFPELADADVRTTWLQYIPWLRWHHEFFPPIRYFIWRFKKLKGYDLVITSSSSENKAVRVSKGTRHIAYIHTPPHYYWRYYKEYLENPGFGKLDPLARIFLRILNPLLRRLDKKSAQNPDKLIANSKFIQSQVKEYYGRESEVVYPPVDIERFKIEDAKKKDYFLVFGRQTVFKKMDLVVEAFKQLPHKLIVVGDGPEHEHLVNLASGSSNISFKTNVGDAELARLVAEAKACVFANEEDFGITWVESIAAGTPVICYGSGGALETVQDGKNGILFYEQSPNEILKSIERFNELTIKGGIDINASPEDFTSKLGSTLTFQTSE